MLLMIKIIQTIIKSNLCDYSDAYILVTGDITETGDHENTKVAFKNCASFTKCVTQINDEHADNPDGLDIVITMYNLIEYTDNYSNTSEGLQHFKREEQIIINDNNPVAINSTNSTSFEYKSNFIKKSDDGTFENVKRPVPLKYLNDFLRSLEMPLINSKIHLQLNWGKSCVMSNVVGAIK